MHTRSQFVLLSAYRFQGPVMSIIKLHFGKKMNGMGDFFPFYE